MRRTALVAACAVLGAYLAALAVAVVAAGRVTGEAMEECQD